jgi:PadR family transcriptional regulator PadR
VVAGFFVCGTAELRVLSLVSSRRRYGYELVKLLGQAGGGVMEIREGTL